MTSTEQAKQMKQRVRTCIGCGEKDDKRSLVRIVRASDGTISVDAKGRAAGRGAYVCSLACYDASVKKGKLARGLKTSVEAETYQQIREELSRVFGESE